MVTLMMYIASMNLKETEKIEKGMQEVKSNENEQIYIILFFPYTFTFLSRINADFYFVKVWKG